MSEQKEESVEDWTGGLSPFEEMIKVYQEELIAIGCDEWMVRELINEDVVCEETILSRAQVREEIQNHKEFFLAVCGPESRWLYDALEKLVRSLKQGLADHGS